MPITDIALPYFERQLVLQEQGQNYYENDLVVSKPNGAPIRSDWVSARFGKKLEAWGMPRIRFHDLRHSAAANMHQMTGDFYTVGEVSGHTLGGINASLGLSMGYEAGLYWWYLAANNNLPPERSAVCDYVPFKNGELEI